LLDHIRRPLGHQPGQLGLLELVRTRLADAGGDVAEQLVDELADERLGVGPLDVRAEQADPAVDVVADSAGRDHAAFLGVGRGHPSDGEPVAPMDVGHRQAGLLDAGQRGDVDHLLGAVVELDRLHQRLVGEDQAVDPHVLAVPFGNPVLARPDLFKRPLKSVRLAHLCLDLWMIMIAGATVFDDRFDTGGEFKFASDQLRIAVQGVSKDRMRQK